MFTRRANPVTDNQRSDKWISIVSNFMKIPRVGDELFHPECVTVRQT